MNGIVVSGTEEVIKPDREIFDLLISRYQILPEQSTFIDDNYTNNEAAKNVGFNTIHFKSPEQLMRELHDLGVGAYWLYC